MRSNVSALAGFNLQSKIDVPKLAEIQVGSLVVFDHDAGRIPDLRAAIPDLRICLRMFGDFRNPESVAQMAAPLAAQYLRPGDGLTWANEPNVEYPGLTPGEMADLCRRFVAAWRTQAAPADLVSPALSPSAPYADAFPALREAWADYRWIGIHAYRGAEQHLTAYRQTWPDKDCWVTEFGTPFDRNPSQADQQQAAAEWADQFLTACGHLGYVYAADWFLFDSPDPQWARWIARDTPVESVFYWAGRSQTVTPPELPRPVIKEQAMPSNAEARVYIDWAAARWDAGQDHRDLAAFQAHLQALGADYMDPVRFGWPGGFSATGGAPPPLPADPPAPFPTPVKPLFFEDVDRVDVGPLILKYAAEFGVPVEYLIALVHAESGWNTNAIRRGVWPDVSGGYSQMTIQTARAYGLGNGSPEPANVQAVLTALTDRETGVRLAAQHLASCLAVVDERFPGLSVDDRYLYGVRAYNGGAGYGLTEDYARRYSSNLLAYRQALDITRRVLQNKGWAA